MKPTEKAFERVNVCIKNIEIMMDKRVKELFSELCCDYAPLLEFESASTGKKKCVLAWKLHFDCMGLEDVPNCPVSHKSLKLICDK